MVHAGLGWLAAADATALAAETQARCLQGLEQATAMGTAARASVLAAFTSGQGYCAEADYRPRAWPIHKTRIRKAAAGSHTGWARRTSAHPQVLAVLAGGQMSESYGRAICTWTDKLPQGSRADADEILLAAARAGMELPDLAVLAREMFERSRPDTPDEDPDRAEEDRTHEQRYHDALREAMRRLLAAGLLPERAGQPVKALVHVSLAGLMLLEGSSALMREWSAGVRAAWAAHRAGASAGGSDGGAWLDGAAARAVTCDASVTPVVTGEVDPAALDDLVRLCAQLAKLHHGGDSTSSDSDGPAAPDPGAARARDALEQAVISKAVALVSGPGGLASFLRRRQLGARLGGPSLPLDVGVSRDIPAAIRRAVILLDQHCRFPGGCDQSAAACEVHHLTHKADGGTTSVTECALFCTFHHQVVIHQQGWTVVLNPDGTTTAWNKDKTKVLHSH